MFAASVLPPRPSGAEGRAGDAARCRMPATTANGPSCGVKAAPSSSRGSRAGPRTNSTAARGASGSAATGKISRRARRLPSSSSRTRSGELLGGITLGNIRHGVAQTGQIGYWIGERYAGQGFMVEALRAGFRLRFETLRLHRIEAACIPDNERSMRVLEKAGFQREGLLRSYLRINGVWQDHYLYALIAGDPGGAKREGLIFDRHSLRAWRIAAFAARDSSRCCAAASPALRHRADQDFARRRRARPVRRRRDLPQPGRELPGLDRARPRRHRAPHRGRGQ